MFGTCSGLSNEVSQEPDVDPTRVVVGVKERDATPVPECGEESPAPECSDGFVESVRVDDNGVIVRFRTILDYVLGNLRCFRAALEVADVGTQGDSTPVGFQLRLVDPSTLE